MVMHCNVHEILLNKLKSTVMRTVTHMDRVTYGNALQNYNKGYIGLFLLNF